MTKEEIQKNSEHWYNKYKELENKIADIKANCDYVLEGKDLEIKQLGERCNQLLKDKGDLTGKNKQLELIILGNQEELENQAVAYETLKLHDQEEIGMLNSRIAELKQQIEKMKEEHKQNELGLVISNSSARVELNEKIEQLEKENAEWEKFVKDIQNRNEENYLKVCHKLATELNRGIELADQLTKAKDLIHQFLIQNPISDWLPKKAEQFLKEIEK